MSVTNKDTNGTGKLWTTEYWCICISHLLLSVSLYILWPVLPSWWMATYHTTPLQTGCMMASFGIGLFLLGPTYAYVTDKYGHKSIYMLSLLLITTATMGFWMVSGVLYMVMLRLMQGMMYGMAFMASGSTLVIDITQSPQRTNANYNFSWFGRFALSIGPLTGLILYECYSMETVVTVSCVLGILAMVCVVPIHILWRAPLSLPKFSKDRFWLSRGWLLFINLLLVSIPTGVLLACITSYEFYALLMVGFFLSLLAIQFAFSRADIRAEVVCGLILYGFAILLLLFHQETTAFYTSAILVGMGIGLIVPRTLLFFIRMSEHCERGTANTTEAFAWELGISLGFLTGFLLSRMEAGHQSCYYTILVSLAMALALYLTCTHAWYMKHKVR